jgi:hypothetical protein
MSIALMFVLGIGISIYSIIMANDMPNYAPWTFGFEASGSFAAGVGTIVFTFHRDLESASTTCLVALLLIGIAIVDARRRGYLVRNHIVEDYKPSKPGELA